MNIYKLKTKEIPGARWVKVNKEAMKCYEIIKKKTKRRSYVRSAYFNKDKIFLDLYWRHLHEKQNLRDKTRRVKFFPCAVELIRNSKLDPISKENPNKRSEILHRFAGRTKNGVYFFVQIKENKKSRQKFLYSTFEANKQKSLPPGCSV
jgi:hypothetical protein